MQRPLNQRHRGEREKQMSKKSFKAGVAAGDRHYRESSKRPWSAGAGLRSAPPRKRGDADFNRGAATGRKIARKSLRRY